MECMGLPGLHTPPGHRERSCGILLERDCSGKISCNRLECATIHVSDRPGMRPGHKGEHPRGEARR
jgi:hypothetical protein